MGSDWKTPLLVCAKCLDERYNDVEISLTHRYIPTNFGVILDIPLNIFTPNERMIVIGFEELRNVAHPCFDVLKSLGLKDMGHVSMHSGNGGGGEVIVEDTESRDRLVIKSTL